MVSDKSVQVHDFPEFPRLVIVDDDSHASGLTMAPLLWPILTALALLCCAADAVVRMPKFFSDGLVLQTNSQSGVSANLAWISYKIEGLRHWHTCAALCTSVTIQV
jgi:hypothetical protein